MSRSRLTTSSKWIGSFHIRMLSHSFLVVTIVSALASVLACHGTNEDAAVVSPLAEEATWAPLDFRIETRMAKGEKGGRLIVFLHGYGSDGADHLAWTRTLLDDRTRLILPTAPRRHATGRGAMWWEFREDDWPRPYPADPATLAKPSYSAQLPLAREAVVRLIARLRDQFAPETVILAGHSQGAMLALDVAVVTEPPPDRVVLLSGYALLDSVPNITRSREVTPVVLISHGQSDPVVPFSAAKEMRQLLEENGFSVEFNEFAGGHGIESSVVAAVSAFVRPTASPGVSDEETTDAH